MKCTNCGRDISGDCKFCPFCGTKTGIETTLPQKAVSEKKKTGVIIAIVAMALVIMLLLSLFFIKATVFNFSTSSGNSSGGNDPFIQEDSSPVEISFATSNVENYPEISLYFKIADENGNSIDNLSKKSFKIREYIDINDYLERDIIYAEKIDGRDSLNVCLALDRSSSISAGEMDQIKRVTKTFLSNLQFDTGDKAEIVSFESTVMRMCLFTNNRDLLTNGIDSMYPIAQTALYDAIVKSIYDASAQSGARCVIVFTDGDDTSSTQYGESDVIRIAKEKSVPVYTIGVGDGVKEGILRNIANSTGGWYRHINDIDEMGRMYEDIYRDQKNLYHIKYISDDKIGRTQERRIVLSVNGEGYGGICDKTYTPVIPATKTNHSSRYEIISADVSWEEADRLCIEKGGHLATITSKAEEDIITALVGPNGPKKLWIGGYTTNSYGGGAVGHWVTGEPFGGYTNWYSNSKGTEPSRFDGADNVAEYCLMLWNIDSRGWSWNDQRNDLINSQFSGMYKGQMGYVIEYEN